MPDLLIELFSEEIPARMQGRAASDLKKLMTDGLVEAGLTYASAAAFSTPRRLVLTVEGLLAESPTLREERKGPRVDAPEKALEGFLRATGLTRDQLEPRDDKKGQVWFATLEKPGRAADVIVAEVLERTVRNFPWPKSMRWGAGSLRWVRPLHSILCILVTEAGAETVPLEIDGITAGNTTRGHRFMAPGAEIAVQSFDDYAAKLKRAHVVLDPAERADHIWNDATNTAFAQGLEVVEDASLLTEVAGLVEWPVVLMGAIGADFLDLPPEVLQTSMKEHQKFFSVRNPKTGRIEKFVTVANVETADQGATILAGNQKVLSARLSDAKFFWENDLRVAKAGMDPWTDALDNVTFHNKLGTQAERISRIAALARAFAPRVGADPDLAEEAARIAKADLSSEMVYEFPELQGLMGRYYAEAAGRDAAVAAAAEEHYRPLGPSDAVPDAPVSVAVALADKLDTLAGFWAIDEKPTGSKDPYALRRAALGVIRIVLSNDLRIQLSDFILRGLFQVFLKLQKAEGGSDLRRDYAAAFDISEDDLRDLALDDLQGRIEPDAIRAGIANLNADADADLNTPEHLLGFIHDRLKVYLRDQGIRHDVIDACLARPGADDLTLLVKRATALQAFLDTDDGEPLLQGFKRANNILTQAEARDGVAYEFGPDRKYASDPAELALFDALDAAEPRISAALAGEDYAAAMGEMAGLRAPIDAFFEAVQVNAEEQITRRNRLNLLHRIRETCMTVADLSRLDG
ncbi:glycine--tRNA ligase subunit beta [Pacificitalea manganoxidans]|uniref:Glycine--tRNA ligase beta subunit n=1 Tax=Pacificitalea manganoxidans TaxID=1411902 RepID=A0A291M0E1_9RHOB|nr:glycine--tRNA ligase subunit beta [Pacificitalea manganoxidans]ATI42436.1 glycine--tRNA ligase subunit beta [Pacificitalea manganoxidans]MDR6307713.1 glycyl-tRNA synthetase beta chain [Pacificitalea manganoxidans]